MALDNKLNITDSTELARMEEKISKKKAVELFENGYLNNYEAGTFKMLAAIHKYLFDEIYDFAGKIRTVNIAKGNFRFAPVMYLQAAIENVEKMPQSTFDEIVERWLSLRRRLRVLRHSFSLSVQSSMSSVTAFLIRLQPKLPGFFRRRRITLTRQSA